MNDDARSTNDEVAVGAVGNALGGSQSDFEIRLIVDPPQSGAWNMAVDEALLDSAAEEGVATLRFYQWSEPTLSLGYFQRYAEREQHAASADCVCVRRHSGGGAILHDRELTHSLAIPVASLPGRSPGELYRIAHSAAVDCLSRLAPSASRKLRLSGAGINRSAVDEPFLCFQRRSEGDLLVVGDGGDDKIAGSAQRKRRSAVLQHGSLLLKRSSAAPELPGVAELLDVDVAAGDFAQRYGAVLAERLGAHLAPATLTTAEAENSRRICRAKFAAANWTRRR